MKKENKKNPFKTPEGYFEGFSDALKGRLSKEKIRIPENVGFDVPENYFESVHKNILLTLEAENPKVIRLHPLRKYYYAVASIAAIALVIFALNRNTSEEITFEDLANSDIENYFDNTSLDFSTYEIAEVIPLDNLEISDLLADGLNDDTILNYLDNNTDEFEELNLEYDE